MLSLMTRSIGRWGVPVALAAGLVVSVSCGDTVRQGRSPGYLVIDSLTANSGAIPDENDEVLQSDVLTIVKKKVQIGGEEVDVPTPVIFEDWGHVVLHVDMKNPASNTSPTNSITVSRCRIDYKRTDGRNTPGVDVPFGFDSGLTGTVPGDGRSVPFSFTIVRAAAKAEAPLRALADGGPALFIDTIAVVTFYGRDQAGNDVVVTGQISVRFANWGDPD